MKLKLSDEASTPLLGIYLKELKAACVHKKTYTYCLIPLCKILENSIISVVGGDGCWKRAEGRCYKVAQENRE